MRYFVYRHIRSDTNLPFYIGVGTKPRVYNTLRAEFHRAYAKDRNDRWVKVIGKTAYKIEIVFETDNREEVLQKEIELITLYGRADLGKGSLANFTDGGNVYNYSEKTLALKRSVCVGKRRSIVTEFKNKPIYKLDRKGNIVAKYKSCTEACKIEGVLLSPLVQDLKYVKGYKGFYWCHQKNLLMCRKQLIEKEKDRLKNVVNRPIKLINSLTKVETIFNNFEELGKFINKDTNQVNMWATGRRKTRLNYEFEIL